ncbi:hypothetical protein TWF481_010452 [Arthrobotrys musiformis]|uniref:Rhodopsin domain-containing protein n=1 Tax=Arthrobotrys musiformis TaxID=47236 RepID=A0AAV9W101_9PEZI
MGGPPHPQTEQDREYLRSLFPYFKGLPEDFQFPLAVEHDPPYIPPNNTFYCFVIAVILCSITTVIVVLRLWVRKRRGFGMDDWVMLASFFFYCCFNVVNTFSLFGTGVGYHLYDNSIQDVHNYLVILILYITFLWFTINLTRCSILHLFLRLSHLQSPGQVRYIRTILALSYFFGVITVISCFLECGLPISNLFELRAYMDGTCVGPRSMAFYGPYVAVNVALDGLTFLPPIYILFKTPLAVKKKLNLIFLLFLGVLTMTIGAVRLFVFYQWMLDSYDITWNAVAIALGGLIESSVAAIIASLPALNQTFLRFYHKVTRREGERARIRTISLGLITSLFERVYVSNKPTEFSRYSSNATALEDGAIATSDYVELGDSRSDRPAALPFYGCRQETSNDSLPHQLQRFPYFVDGERVSDPELQVDQAADNISTISVPKRAKVHFPMRRPSSPTISVALETIIVAPERHDPPTKPTLLGRAVTLSAQGSFATCGTIKKMLAMYDCDPVQGVPAVTITKTVTISPNPEMVTGPETCPITKYITKAITRTRSVTTTKTVTVVINDGDCGYRDTKAAKWSYMRNSLSEIILSIGKQRTRYTHLKDKGGGSQPDSTAADVPDSFDDPYHRTIVTFCTKVALNPRGSNKFSEQNPVKYTQNDLCARRVEYISVIAAMVQMKMAATEKPSSTSTYEV